MISFFFLGVCWGPWGVVGRTCGMDILRAAAVPHKRKESTNIIAVESDIMVQDINLNPLCMIL